MTHSGDNEQNCTTHGAEYPNSPNLNFAETISQHGALRAIIAGAAIGRAATAAIH